MILWTVYQINYLRAQANAARWAEEVQLLRKEMEWRVNWFYHFHQIWSIRASNHIFHAGASSFASAQATRWFAFGQKSLFAFKDYLPSTTYRSLFVTYYKRPPV
jgi:hypothetical protein